MLSHSVEVKNDPLQHKLETISSTFVQIIHLNAGADVAIPHLKALTQRTASVLVNGSA